MNKTNNLPEKKTESNPEQHGLLPERRVIRPLRPVLRFSPTAWAKLLFFRDRGPTEVGGFAITRVGNLLGVEDFVTVKQEVSVASVAFDDGAVADFFESQVEAGRKPEQFARIWLHSHPGDSAEPSSTDEETFHRVFGSCQWAVMFILARGGKATARLRFNVGPGGQVLIPVNVDFSAAFAASNRQTWEAEYKTNLGVTDQFAAFGANDWLQADDRKGSCSVPLDWREELEAMDPEERRQVLAELFGELSSANDREGDNGYPQYW